MKNLLNQAQKIVKGLRLLTLIMCGIVILSYAIQSCTRNDNYEFSENTKTNDHLKLFKNSLQKHGQDLKFKLSSERNASIIDAEIIAFEEKIRPDALALIRSYGITDAEIIEAFGSLDSPEISVAAESILMTENLIDNGQTLTMFEDEDYQLAGLSFMGITNVNAQSTSKIASDTIGGCIADAIGITAAFEVIEHGVAGLGRKGVLKLIRKVGGKYLGAIGVALAAYDFADCMGWI